MRPVKSPATYDDLIALPEHVVGEILDGELFASPRPASKHAVAYSALLGTLFNPFHRGIAGPGGWVILAEPELHIGADVMVPDLAGWRRERMPKVPDVPYFTLTPDWVCEIRSPSTAKLDLHRKLPKYGRAGVLHVWIIDPLNRTLEPFVWHDGVWQLLTYEEKGDAHVPPFSEVAVDLEALWAE